MTAARKQTEIEESARVFDALGDPTRLGVVARLCRGGPQSLTSLAADTHVTRQAIAKHLRVLEGAGLVHGTRQGRESRWEMEPRRLEIAREYLAMISERWTMRLDALRRHVEGEKK
jgi:DNA-binding transcriptional ArsR family regulator